MKTRFMLLLTGVFFLALVFMLSPAGAALIRRFDGIAVGSSGISDTGTLSCNGNATFGDASNDITTVAGNCTVNGITTMSSNATVSGILTANGNVTMGDNATADTVTAAGNVTCNSALTVTGNTALNGSAIAIGNASTDVATCTGRLVLRTLGSDPLDGTPGNRPAGTVNEIAVYSGVVYLCTNADTPTWVRVGPPAA